MERYYLEGLINNDGYYSCEADSCLAIKGNEENTVLAEFFEDNFNGKEVYVRYYITDERLPLEETEEQYVKKISGVVEASIYPVYSDVTGYLWCEEAIEVNGHDLFEELYMYEGKYIHMIIEVKE